MTFVAERVGLDADQVSSLTGGNADDACWTTERDRLLIRAVDALHDEADIPDELWQAVESQALATTFSDGNLLDLLLLCGWYHATSFVARSVRVPLEPGAPKFASIRHGGSPPDEHPLA